MRKRKLRRLEKAKEKLNTGKPKVVEPVEKTIEQKFMERKVEYPNLKPVFYEHRNMVNRFMAYLIKELRSSVSNHDFSKLEPEEAPLFEKYCKKLKNITYNSEEYKKYLEELKPALNHHYKQNRHHPEHFENGISGMNLLDVLEMLCDWTAASTKQKEGNIFKSLEENQKRFNYSDDLKSILENTAKLLIKLDKDVENKYI